MQFQGHMISKGTGNKYLRRHDCKTYTDFFKTIAHIGTSKSHTKQCVLHDVDKQEQAALRFGLADFSFVSSVSMQPQQVFRAFANKLQFVEYPDLYYD